MRNGKSSDGASTTGRLTRAAPRPGCDSPLTEWAALLLPQRLEALLEAVPAAHSGEDNEGLHDLRVATRRLSAAMSIFDGCFTGSSYRRFSRDVRRVRRSSGALRDLDVLSEHLAEERAGLTGTSRLAMRYLLALVDQWRGERRKELVDTLAWLEKRDLQGQLESVLSTAAASSPITFRQAASRRLVELYLDLTRYFEFVSRPDAETELHEMRVAFKRVRYSMEIFSPCYADRLKKMTGTVKSLQDALGLLHDSDYRRGLLTELCGQRLKGALLRRASPAIASDIESGMPQLLEREESRRRQLYQDFFSQWQELETKAFTARLVDRISSPDAPDLPVTLSD